MSSNDTLKAAIAGNDDTQTKPRTALAMLSTEVARTQIGQALPSHLDAETFTRHAITLVKQTPALGQCEPTSVVQGIIRGAALGLDFDPVLGQAWLVPRNGVATFQVGYKGWIDLAMRSGRFAKVEARAVHERDRFAASYGVDGGLRHEPDHWGDRGPVVGWYAWALYRDGTDQHETLSIAQAEAHRDRYGKGSKFWRDNFDDAALRTVILRLMKLLPKSAEYADAIEADGKAWRQTAAGSVIEATISPSGLAAVGVGDGSPAPVVDELSAPESTGDSPPEGDPPGREEPDDATQQSIDVDALTTTGAEVLEAEDAERFRRKMFALVGEAFARFTDADDRETRRKALIGLITGGRTESSGDLDATERGELIEALDNLIAGKTELMLRSQGTWALRTKAGAKR